LFKGAAPPQLVAWTLVKSTRGTDPLPEHGRRTGSKQRKEVANEKDVMLALTVLMMAAAPALARDNYHNRHNDKNNNFFDRHHDFNDFDHNGDHNDVVFTGISPFLVAPEVDVDVEEVGKNNDLEGECFVTDIDGNGSIDDWEVELTCFV